jgi:uncharacterized repeat protein (TIGR03803 family)
MTRVNSWKSLLAVFFFCTMAAIASRAQTFTTLLSFDGADGYRPSASVVQGPNGNLYGTTFYGKTGCHYRNASVCSTVFAITPEGVVPSVYTFCKLANCVDGTGPAAPPVLATNGKFFGTAGGGADLCGIVFELTQAGALTTLHTFDDSDGCGPQGLIQAVSGDLYGTTFEGGGANNNGVGGTVLKITEQGTLTTLHSFCALSNCPDGNQPDSLVQATDGNFYGTTFYGGAIANQYCASGCGTVFRITAAGTLTTLYSFCSLSICADGSQPVSLIQATNGNLYGTAASGGANGVGTVFEITPDGVLTTLYSFCSLPNCADGWGSGAPLVQGTDGNFYGATETGGAAGGGTVFKITPTGALTTLYNFCSLANCADGAGPNGLLQATNGMFYGTTAFGGTYIGTVFSLDTGLDPFVAFVRSAAKVRQEFGILGQGFTGATSVSLNGVSAGFTVKSDTLLTAIVPAGATTGYVTVATPSGTLASSVPFRVIP